MFTSEVKGAFTAFDPKKTPPDISFMDCSEYNTGLTPFTTEPEVAVEEIFDEEQEVTGNTLVEWKLQLRCASASIRSNDRLSTFGQNRMADCYIIAVLQAMVMKDIGMKILMDAIQDIEDEMVTVRLYAKIEDGGKLKFVPKFYKIHKKLYQNMAMCRSLSNLEKSADKKLCFWEDFGPQMLERAYLLLRKKFPMDLLEKLRTGDEKYKRELEAITKMIPESDFSRALLRPFRNDMFDIDWGLTSSVLEAMLGVESDNFPKNLYDSGLKISYNSGCMTVACIAWDKESSELCKKNLLLPNHWYSVVKIVKTRHGLFVQVFDPSHVDDITVSSYVPAAGEMTPKSVRSFRFIKLNDFMDDEQLVDFEQWSEGKDIKTIVQR